MPALLSTRGMLGPQGKQPLQRVTEALTYDSRLLLRLLPVTVDDG